MKTFRTKHTIIAPRAGLGLLSLQLAAAPVASAWSLTINLGLGVNSAAPVRTQRTLSPLEGWSPPVLCDYRAGVRAVRYLRARGAVTRVMISVGRGP